MTTVRYTQKSVTDNWKIPNIWKLNNLLSNNPYVMKKGLKFNILSLHLKKLQREKEQINPKENRRRGMIRNRRQW